MEKAITITCPYNPAHQISVEGIQVPTSTSQLKLHSLNLEYSLFLFSLCPECPSSGPPGEVQGGDLGAKEPGGGSAVKVWIKLLFELIVYFRRVRDSLLSAHLGRGRGLSASESQQVKI